MNDSWEETTLGACFNQVRKRVQPSEVDESALFVGMENLASSRPTVASQGTTASVTSAVTPFESEDTLFGRLRPYLRKVALAPSSGFCSPEILVLRPRLERVRPRFLHLLASSEAVIQKAVEMSAGSRMPRVSVADLAASDVSVPSLPGQDRIVSFIRCIDDQIAALEAEALAVSNLRRGLLRSRTEQSTSEVRLESIADVSQGKSLPKERQGAATGDVSWFKIADMTKHGNQHGFTSAETQMTEEELSSLGGVVLPVGTVVFPRVGAAVLTEKKRILDVPGAVDENHLVLRPHAGTNAEYLLATMEAVRLSDFVQTGAVPSLNMGLIRSLVVPWHMDDQQVIGEALGAIRVASRAWSEEIKSLRAVRSSALTALLNRDLEIPESFDELLTEEAMV